MAHRIALITDSTCDIPSAWREQYEIGVVPLSIVFGSQSFLDGVELSADQFYARLPVDASHPSTSQPTPEAFAAAYKQAAESGAEEILVLTISSFMSGTIESARSAAEEAPIPVNAVDSAEQLHGAGLAGDRGCPGA